MEVTGPCPCWSRATQSHLLNLPACMASKDSQSSTGPTALLWCRMEVRPSEPHCCSEGSPHLSKPMAHREGSSRHSALASFLLHFPAATPMMGEESSSDLWEAALPDKILQVSSTLGFPGKLPGEGSRPLRLRGKLRAWPSHGSSSLMSSLARAWLGGMVGRHSSSLSTKTPWIHMPFTQLTFNYTA